MCSGRARRSGDSGDSGVAGRYECEMELRGPGGGVRGGRGGRECVEPRGDERDEFVRIDCERARYEPLTDAMACFCATVKPARRPDS